MQGKCITSTIFYTQYFTHHRPMCRIRGAVYLLRELLMKLFTQLTKFYRKSIIFLKQPERFFLVTASLFGILFILIIPPLQTPDEHVHFYRAYEVSELNSNRLEKDGRMGSMLPASIAKTEVVLNAQSEVPTHIQFNPYTKYDLRQTKAALLDIPLNEDEKSFYRTETYPEFLYTLQALAITLGKIFDAPIVVMIYLTRLVNLALWITVAFLCIKYFPWKKWAVAGVCLLPVVVAQTISPGLDVLAISSFFVFITIILNSVHNRQHKLSYKMVALLAFAGLLMVFAKSNLAVFLPLIFLVKKEQISLKYQNLIKTLIVVLPIMLFAAWTIFISTSHDAQPVSSTGQQISTFLHNPLNFLILLFKTIFFNTASGNTLAQSLVGNFGWLDTPLSTFIIYLGVMYIAFIMFVGSRGDECKLSKKNRIILLTAAVASVLATFLAMYVYSTLPSDNHIKGVQGRYLIPALIMLVPVLMSHKIITSKVFFIRTIQFGSIGLLTISALTIMTRYYHVYIPT